MPNPKGLLVEIAEVAALALGLYLVITFAVQTVYVLGPSMYPTAVDQDYLIALRLPYRFHGPERGDIVIMRSPFDSSQDFIKRVVGLPGDTILVQSCKVSINGHVLAEPYITSGEPWTNCSESWPQNGRAQVLGRDEYFVMGDHRDDSTDSRSFGPVKRSQIQALAWLRVLPINHFGLIDTQRPYITARKMPAAA